MTNTKQWDGLSDLQVVHHVGDRVTAYHLVPVGSQRSLCGVERLKTKTWVQGSGGHTGCGKCISLSVEMAKPADHHCKEHLGQEEDTLPLNEWMKFAAEKRKTHTQSKCKGCGLFKIWRPKKEKVHGRDEAGALAESGR